MRTLNTSIHAVRPLEYLRAVFDSRELWLHLSRIELKNKFRRTHLGALWLVVQPFMFAMVIAFVFGQVFGRSIRDFSVHVLSGIILWDWFQSTMTTGSQSLVGSTAFVRQQRLPNVIYPLKTFIALSLSFAIASLGLFAWIGVIHRDYFNIWWLLIPANVVFIGAAIMPLTIWSSLLGVMFRDFRQSLDIILRAWWFLSPVFIAKSAFEGGGAIGLWDRLNPVSNMLRLWRDPIIEGHPPSLENYMIVAGFGLTAYVLAIIAVRFLERRVVYYL